MREDAAMRRTIKAVMIAFFAIVFFAVVPSVSASAATGGAPAPCSPATCTAPKLPPTNQSSDGTSVDTTVPLPVHDCGVNTSCTQTDGPETLPVTDSRSFMISVYEFNALNGEVRDAQIWSFVAGTFAIASSIAVLLLLLVMALTNRRHRRELESKKATPSYTFH